MQRRYHASRKVFETEELKQSTMSVTKCRQKKRPEQDEEKNEEKLENQRHFNDELDNEIDEEPPSQWFWDVRVS